MLRDASIADDGVADFVRRHGLPDGIALHSMALEIQLAYVGEGKLYVLRHTALEAVTPRAWNSSSLASERELSEDEIELLDPERRMARRVESTRRYIDAYARVHSVGRKCLLALPPEAAGEPGYDFGFLSTRVNDVTIRLFELPADLTGILVASVDPEGPSAAALQAGDLIVEIDGQPIGGGSKSAAKPRSGPSREGRARGEGARARPGSRDLAVARRLRHPRQPRAQRLRGRGRRRGHHRAAGAAEERRRAGGGDRPRARPHHARPRRAEGDGGRSDQRHLRPRRPRFPPRSCCPARGN